MTIDVILGGVLVALGIVIVIMALRERAQGSLLLMAMGLLLISSGGSDLAKQLLSGPARTAASVVRAIIDIACLAILFRVARQAKSRTEGASR